MASADHGGFQQRLLAAALIEIGLLADSVAALLALRGAVVVGLALHLPAAGGWALGVHLAGLTQLSGSAPLSRQGIRAPLWRFAIPGVALALFPGLGPVGCTLAFVVSRSSRTGSAPSALNVEALGGRTDRSGGAIDAPSDASTPLVEGGPVGHDHGASNEVVQRLRSQLADPELEVRSRAAVALSRLDNEWRRRIRDAQAAVQADGAGADPYLRLADVYVRWATAGIIDHVSERFYLLRAQQALTAARKLAPGRQVKMSLDRLEHDISTRTAVES